MNCRVRFSNSRLSVGIIWLVGMMIGLAFAYFSNASIAPDDFGAIFMPPSFLGILLSSVLPICAAVLACRLRIHFLVYVILLLNGFVFGFCSLYLSNLFDCPGFITHLFFMFSQSCCSTLLVALCLTFIFDGQKVFRTAPIRVISVSVFICILDYFITLKFI